MTLPTERNISIFGKNKSGNIEEFGEQLKSITSLAFILEVNMLKMQNNIILFDKTRYHKSIFTDEYDKKIGLKNNETKCKNIC